MTRGCFIDSGVRFPTENMTLMEKKSVKGGIVSTRSTVRFEDGQGELPPRLFPATTCVFFDALSIRLPLLAASSTLFFHCNGQCGDQALWALFILPDHESLFHCFAKCFFGTGVCIRQGFTGPRSKVNRSRDSFCGPFTVRIVF